MEMNDIIKLMWVSFLKGKTNIAGNRKLFDEWINKDYPALTKFVFKFPQNVCGTCFQPDCNCKEDTQFIDLNIKLEDGRAFMSENTFYSIQSYKQYPDTDNFIEGQMWRQVMTPDLTPSAWYLHIMENGDFKSYWINLTNETGK